MRMTIGRQWDKKISYTHTHLLMHRTKVLESDYKVEVIFDKNDKKVAIL